MIDMIGKKFGRLLVLNIAGRDKTGGSIKYNCVCDCGTEKVISGSSLRSGNTKSCGCFMREQASKTHKGVLKSAKTKRLMSENNAMKRPEVRKKVGDTQRGVPRPSVTGRNHGIWKERIIVRCNNCGDEIKRIPSDIHNHNFCDRKCKGEWLKENLMGENNPCWRGGVSFEPYCDKFTLKLKQQIRDLYNNCDFISGLPDYICNVMRNGKARKLDVHHVDSNKMQGCDSIEWKLVPLSRKNHSIIQGNDIFWERLICYALEYDETYYDIIGRYFGND